jgi:N-acetylglucosamine-6-phosphate deacetylase
MASLTPAEIAGCANDLGSLAPGKFADILILDENVNVHATFLAGKQIEFTRA